LLFLLHVHTGLNLQTGMFEIFPFSAGLELLLFLLHVHTGLNLQTGMFEHAKVQLLLIKFNTRTPGKIYLELQRCRFRNFGVLGTTLKFAK